MHRDDASQIREQWTSSRSALVLTGGVTTLIDIAQRLNLPDETVIETRHGQAVLGLWGDPLSAYQALKRQGQLPQDRDRTT